MSNQLIVLSCPVCGNKLQIGQKVNRFACTNCGNELAVHRETGIIYLEPLTNNAGGTFVTTNTAPVNGKKKGWFARLPVPIRFILICFGIIFFFVIVLPKSTPEQQRAAAATDQAIALRRSETATAIATLTPKPTVTPTSTPMPTATPTPTIKQMQDTAEAMPFRELSRNTEKYVGKLLKYDGKVIQVMENSGDYELRVNVTKDKSNNWTDTIFLICAQCPTRPLEDDIVSFVGSVDGRLTYKSTLGGDITLPKLTARVFDVTSK